MSGKANARAVDPDVAMDDDDVAILCCVRQLYAAADPVPGELYTRIDFALDLDGLERELARIGADLELGAAARGVEQARTITFECESVTIAVTITPTGVHSNRVDGWIAPAAALYVEIRSAERMLHTSSDDGGRFAFDDVAPGRMQLTIRPRADSALRLDRAIVTQPIVL